MRKAIKRVVAVFLAAAIGISVMSPAGAAIPGLGFAGITASAAATSGSCGDALTWSYNTNSKKLTISGKGEMWDWIKKDPGWYGYSSKIKTVEIKDGVTRIGDYAFYYCTALNSISIPSSVESIGANAFESTAYYNNNDNWTKNVLYIGSFLIVARPDKLSGTCTVKNKTAVIADNAFYDCTKLTAVAFPKSIKTIGKYAFFRCSQLKSVALPETLKAIGNSAFSSCTKLDGITIEKAVTKIGKNAFLNTAYYNNKENWTEDSALYIDKHLIRVNAQSASGSFKTQSGTISIADAAFSGCNLLSAVSVSSGITSLGDETFYSCTALTKVTLPKTLTEIGVNAFYNCKKLDSLSLPSALKRIKNGAFSFCSTLKSVEIPKSVTSIDDSAFYGCTSLISFTASSDNSSYTCVSGVLFNKGKTALVQYPSANTRSSYKIPTTVKTVLPKAFANCGFLTTVTLPSSMTEVADYMFYKCPQLTKVTLPSSIKTVGVFAFSLCTALKAIDLPAKLTKLDVQAFGGCKKLASINIPPSVKSIARDAFDECAKSFVIFCSNGSYAQSFAESNSIKCKLLVAKAASLKTTSSSASAIRLTWKKVSKASGYRVYIYNSAKKKYYAYGDVTSNSCTVGGLEAGKSYRFKVCAYRELNGARYWGVRSDSAASTTDPAKVTGLMATSRTKSSVTLNWSKVSGATGYCVYKYDTAKKTYVLYKTVKKAKCTVSGLKSETSYSFRVKAYRTYNKTDFFGVNSATLRVKTK